MDTQELCTALRALDTSGYALLAATELERLTAEKQELLTVLRRVAGRNLFELWRDADLVLKRLGD